MCPAAKSAGTKPTRLTWVASRPESCTWAACHCFFLSRLKKVRKNLPSDCQSARRKPKKSGPTEKKGKNAGTPPRWLEMVGAHGLEPWTSSLSETRSNQLSYAPAAACRSPAAKQCNTTCLTWPGLPGSPSAAEWRKRGAENAGLLLEKEVIQPQVPLRLPCYDFIPVIETNLDACLLAVGSAASGGADFHDVTGGVYKARERIQGAVADAPLLAIPTSCSRVADCSPNWGRLSGFAKPRGLAALCTGHCSTFAAPGVRAIRT